MHNSMLMLGNVQCYFRITNCNCKKICKCPGMNYARIQRLFTLNPFFVNIEGGDLGFIYEYTGKSDLYYMINVNNLKDVCFYIEIENHVSYICKRINMLEFE